MTHLGPARTRRMTGRDPHEPARSATPLELLFDLAFVVAFGVAGEQAAHAVVEDHVGVGLLGFVFSMFAIVWAWINFSWFASAFDTDDRFYRVTTMVQMIGVVVLALGLPDMFHSLEEGDRVHNEVMVAGYVVMRLALLVQWLRAARQAPEYRATCHMYARVLVLTQIGWIALAIAPVDVPTFFVAGAILGGIEMTGPRLAERIPGGGGGLRGTPWHAHHIVERYGLLAIITLGEGVIGTVASLSAVVEDSGWTVDAALVAVAGIGLTFGLWWTYYITPASTMLHRHRERSFAWGYGQMAVIASLASVGAGLHVAASYLGGESHLGAVGTVVAVAVPVLVFVVADYTLHWVVMRTFDAFHVWLVLGAVALLAGAVVAAGLGVDMAWALLLVMLAPAVSVVGFETVGHRHQERALAADAG
ncbi:low temperature requirement protein A [Antribacter gilvus]|uniref:low temperature requirement protein A n=1 Tax=Antribacter gilvus TaxID=2304675 RepID=UPI001F0C9F0F|nr:low temperature requirement protein A [Antribacter gilvus]